MSYEGNYYTSDINAIRASYPDASGLRGTGPSLRDGYAEAPKIDVDRSLQDLSDLANLAVRGLVSDPHLRIEPLDNDERHNFQAAIAEEGGRDYGSGYTQAMDKSAVPEGHRYSWQEDPRNVNDIYKNPDGSLAPYKYKARLLLEKNMTVRGEGSWRAPTQPVILTTGEPLRTHSMQGRQVGVHGELFGRIDDIRDNLNDAQPIIPISTATGRTNPELSPEQIDTLIQKTDDRTQGLIKGGYGLIPAALRINYRASGEDPNRSSNGVYIPVSPGLDNQYRPFKIGHRDGAPTIQRLSAAELYQVEKDIRQMNDRYQNPKQGS